MNASPGGPRHEHFTDLPDPRIARAKRHSLLAIVTIVLCGVIGGADSWVEIARVGRAKRAWRETRVSLPKGIPSDDTCGRVFAALEPAAFASALLGGGPALVTTTAGERIAIDGTTRRRAHDRTQHRAALQLVSAWAPANHVVLGQVATARHSNASTAIPVLRELLTRKDAVMTSDARGCQPAIADQIVTGAGDSVCARKANPPTQHELGQHHFAITDEEVGHRTVDKEHGRREIRTCRATDEPAVLAWLDPQRAWPGLRSIAAVTDERRIGETVTTDTRSSLSSLAADPERIGTAVRTPWGIANGLHWVLDMAFREDDSRVRGGHAAENFGDPSPGAHAVEARDNGEGGDQGQAPHGRRGRNLPRHCPHHIMRLPCIGRTHVDTNTCSPYTRQNWHQFRCDVMRMQLHG